MGVKVRVIYELDFCGQQFEVYKWGEFVNGKSEKERVCRVRKNNKGSFDNDDIQYALNEFANKTDPRRDIMTPRTEEEEKRWKALPEAIKTGWWQRLGFVADEMDSQGVNSLYLFEDFANLLKEYKEEEEEASKKKAKAKGRPLLNEIRH